MHRIPITSVDDKVLEKFVIEYYRRRCHLPNEFPEYGRKIKILTLSPFGIEWDYTLERKDEWTARVWEDGIRLWIYEEEVRRLFERVHDIKNESYDDSRNGK